MATRTERLVRRLREKSSGDEQQSLHLAQILLEIAMRRYENRSTLMTSNRPMEEWGKLLSDVPAASAILDRLLHHAEIIAINGRSYRLQESAQRRGSASCPKEKKSAAAAASKPDDLP